MPILSLFQNTFVPFDNQPLPAIIQMIRKGQTADLVHQYRRHLQAHDRLNARLVRRHIPSFSPSGLFQGLWGANGLQSYSQLLLLETEPLHHNLIPYYRRIIQQDPLTRACFRSLAGDTLRILVNTTGAPDAHFQAFSELKHYYELLLNLRCTNTGDDLLTLSHISYDPAAFLNPDSEVFQAASNQPSPPRLPSVYYHAFPFASVPVPPIRILPANA
jgi:hypothetical protein